MTEVNYEIWPVVMQGFQIFSSIGIGLGGLTAITALFFTGRKTLEHQWSQEFRKLYDEFWQDKTAQHVRRLISYQDEYDTKLKPSLMKILENRSLMCHIDWSLTHTVSDEDQKSHIESLDIFLSKIIQIGFLPRLYFFQKRNRQMRDIFLRYWIIEINDRPELRMYIDEEWSLFKEFVNEISMSEADLQTKERKY